MSLRTTTWKERNYNRLQETRKEAIKLGLLTPTIIDIGPGGLVAFLFYYFPKGDYSEWTLRESIVRGMLKLVESPLRKTSLFPLQSSEPGEIVEIFGDLNPRALYIVDLEPRVIEAAKRLLGGLNINSSVRYMNVDISAQQIPYQGEIVIAFNVASRTMSPQKSLESIANSVANGGLLTTDQNVDLPAFTQIKSGIYLKNHGNGSL